MISTIVSALSAFVAWIPESVWGIAFGSLISFSAVMLATRAGDKRLLAQFKHERDKATKDREMSLRKEVFFDAADAVSAGIDAIPNFANLNVAVDNITSDVRKKSSALGRVYVIAKIETIERFVELQTQLGEIYLKLFARRAELEKESAKLKLIDSQVEQFGKERDRFLEMIKQHNIEGTRDQRKWDVLHGNFEFEQTRITKLLEEREALVASVAPVHAEFIRECAAHVQAVRKASIGPLLAAVRAELELEFNHQAFQALTNESVAKQSAALDAFVNQLMPSNTQPPEPEKHIHGSTAEPPSA